MTTQPIADRSGTHAELGHAHLRHPRHTAHH